MLKSHRPFPFIGCCLLSAVAVALLANAPRGAAQEEKKQEIRVVAGVDNTRMGAYRALAQLSFQAFQNGDNAAAAKFARILERTWDQGEWKNKSEYKGSICRTNLSVCKPIDEAMDVYIAQLKKADPAAVQAAYNDFQEKLKQAD